MMNTPSHSAAVYTPIYSSCFECDDEGKGEEKMWFRTVIHTVKRGDIEREWNGIEHQSGSEPHEEEKGKWERRRFIEHISVIKFSRSPRLSVKAQGPRFSGSKNTSSSTSHPSHTKFIFLALTVSQGVSEKAAGFFGQKESRNEWMNGWMREWMESIEGIQILKRKSRRLAHFAFFCTRRVF